MSVTDVNENSRLLRSLQPHVPLLLAVCTKLFVATHRHQTHCLHPPSVRADRNPKDKSSVVTSFETDIYQVLIGIASTVHLYIRDILVRVASVRCSPGAWRRGSWHFQVASLHVQLITDQSVRFT